MSIFSKETMTHIIGDLDEYLTQRCSVQFTGSNDIIHVSMESYDEPSLSGTTRNVMRITYRPHKSTVTRVLTLDVNPAELFPA